MKKTVKKLKFIFWTMIAASAIIATLFESDMIPVGAWATNKNIEFICTLLMELLALAAIPSALRMFKTRYVASELSANGITALSRWATFRILLIGVPMICNTLLYYMFMLATFEYLVIILLISMLFVYPSMRRCTYEIENDSKE